MKYKKGHTNSYGHVIVLVIDVYFEFYKRNKIKKKVITKMISFLQNINKKI